jgi:hypothetical protein
VLEGIARRHANPHIRVAAYQAIVAIEPAQHDAIARRARKDLHAYVRHMANYLTGSPRLSQIPDRAGPEAAAPFGFGSTSAPKRSERSC